MAALIQRFQGLFRSSRPVPADYKRVFWHLYMDIAWYGILAGTTQAFLGVFATRQGASPQQIGMLSAVPALVTLFMSLPVGAWLAKREVGKAVFWASIFQRIWYLVLILLPVLFEPSLQVWIIIWISFVMTIPGTALTVGFNALFADAVPVEWRAHVVSMRTGLLAILTTGFSWLSGWMLDQMPFPLGYQVLFVIGFFGAAMSSLHLYLLIPVADRRGVLGVAGNQWVDSLSRQVRDLSQVFRNGISGLRTDVMRGDFARLMGLFFFFHIVQFLVVPIVTPFAVNELKYSDQLIGLGGGIFNLAIFLASLRLSVFSAKWGNKKVTGIGIICMGSYPILLSLVTNPAIYIAAHIAGGIAWAMAGAGLYNFILEKIPAEDRAAYLAWYSMISNGAILIGSMAGPALAETIGFPTALLLFGLGRMLAGILILRFG